MGDIELKDIEEMLDNLADIIAELRLKKLEN
jgi:hypothetical protein